MEEIINFKGIDITVTEEFGEWCYSYRVDNHLYTGYFKTYEKALEVAMNDIEGLK